MRKAEIEELINAWVRKKINDNDYLSSTLKGLFFNLANKDSEFPYINYNFDFVNLEDDRVMYEGELNFSIWDYQPDNVESQIIRIRGQLVKEFGSEIAFNDDLTEVFINNDDIDSSDVLKHIRTFYNGNEGWIPEETKGILHKEISFDVRLDRFLELTRIFN